MSLDTVRAAVLERARSEADALRAAATAEAETLRAESDAEDAKRVEAALRETARRAEEERQRELGKRRGRNRMELLAEKNRRLDDAFLSARKKFLALPAGDRAEVVLGWLNAEATDVGGVLRVVPADREAVQARLDGWNAKRAATARVTEVVEDPTLSGGARIVGAKLSVDGTLDGRMARLRERLSSEVAEWLFSAPQAVKKGGK